MGLWGIRMERRMKRAVYSAVLFLIALALVIFCLYLYRQPRVVLRTHIQTKQTNAQIRADLAKKYNVPPSWITFGKDGVANVDPVDMTVRDLIITGTCTGCPTGQNPVLTGITVTGNVKLTGTSYDCTDFVKGVNGIWEDSINPVACGVKGDLRAEPALATAGTNCQLNPGTPGTVSGCTTLGAVTADANKLVRVVGTGNSVPAATGTNLFTGCVASVDGACTITLGTLPPAWFPTTPKTLNSVLRPRSYINNANDFYKATTPGTTGATEPDWSVCQTPGCTVNDGSVIWTDVDNIISAAGACSPVGYMGSTTTHVFTQIGTDDTPAWQRTADIMGDGTVPAPPIRILAPDRLSAISATILFRGKNGVFAGHGSMPNGWDYSEPAGSGMIWFGARGESMLRLLGDFIFQIRDFGLTGNSNPDHKARSCITIAQPRAPVHTSRFVSAGNTLENVSCNYGARMGQDPDTGGLQAIANYVGANAAKTTLSTYGIEWSPEFNAQNERMRMAQIYVNKTDVCFAELMQQAVANEIIESTCGSSGIAFALPNGGDMAVEHPIIISSGLWHLVGGVGRMRVNNEQGETDFLGASQTYNSQLLKFDQSGGVFVTSGQIPIDWNIPESGVFIDGPGTGIFSVYPGASKTVQIGQIMQPPIQYPDWKSGRFYWRPTDMIDKWYPNSPFAPLYIIKPVNNNAAGNYFRVSDSAQTVGPGISGTTEPNWDANCGVPSTFCPQEGIAPGIVWYNIGNYLQSKIIVPQSNNPNGYAFELTTPGQAGTQYPNFGVAIGSTVTDGAAVWTNVGVYPTNNNLWAYKAVIPWWFANTAYPANFVTRPGANLARNPGQYYYQANGT